MDGHDRGPAMDVRPRSFGLSGCLTLVVAIIAVGIAAFVLLIFVFPFGGGEFPELRRPSAEIRGQESIETGDSRMEVFAILSLDEGAVDAATAGDGLVHLQFDVGGLERTERIEIGVRWADRAEVVVDGDLVAPDEDVRWTLDCAAVAPCERTIAVTVKPVDASAPVQLDWRLSAEVRPRRGADVSDDATITLSETEEDR
jgi:hypothetical protein